MGIIIGIDPGSRITGYGIISHVGKQLSYVASGCIRTKDEALCRRLTEIFDGVSFLMDEYQPEQSAIESVFMHQNAAAALKLGQARGVAMVAMSRHGLNVNEYSPRQIKQAVVGTGAAKKEQVQHMVTSMLSLSAVPQVDAADGLAIAICHAHTQMGLAGINATGRRKYRRSRLV